MRRLVAGCPGDPTGSSILVGSVAHLVAQLPWAQGRWFESVATTRPLDAHLPLQCPQGEGRGGGSLKGYFYVDRHGRNLRAP